MTEPGMGRFGTAYLRAIQAAGRYLPYGTNVYEREWNVLVVLDACRADLMAAVAPDTELLGDVDTLQSVGSSSSEWLEKTFGGRPETARTDMVTGNTWTDRYLEADWFATLDEVWKYAWDNSVGTVPAEAVTDRAIAVARDRNPEYLVVHYMQPHHPFVADPVSGDEGLARTSEHNNTANPWVLLREGQLSSDRVWNAYEATLQHVLAEVKTLVANVSGTVAITADHGNLFGEWGLYGHPMRTPLPELLNVPWATVQGAGNETYEPTLDPPEPLPVSRVYGVETYQERLAALGYR